MDEATTRVSVDKHVLGYWRVTLNHPPINTIDDLMYDEIFDLAQAIDDRLVQDASIIRNRRKIQATIDNARTMIASSPTLAELARTYETTSDRAPRSIAELPASTPQAEALAKQLKSQGYRFVGPTSVYAFMQNIGMVNDHIHGCFRAADYHTAAAPGHGGA